MAKAIDLSKLLKNINSGWVAVSTDYSQVVATGKNFKVANRKVENLPRGSVFLMPVVKSFRNIVTGTI